MAVHGGGYLPGYSGRIDHAWGAREDCHAELPLPPTTYLRIYLDTVVFSYTSSLNWSTCSAPTTS